MYARLIFRSGKHSGRELIMQHRKILLGSGKDCALRIRSHGVAVHHCAVFVSGGALAVHHLASHGKTYVDDKSIKGTQRLQPGDLLRVGSLKLEIQFDPAELARAASSAVPQMEETERRGADSSRASERSSSPESPATRVVGVCESKQWNTCSSPSDAAAGALKQLSRHE